MSASASPIRIVAACANDRFGRLRFIFVFLCRFYGFEDFPLPIVVGRQSDSVVFAPVFHAHAAVFAVADPLTPFKKVLICVELLQVLFHAFHSFVGFPMSVLESIAVYETLMYCIALGRNS